MPDSELLMIAKTYFFTKTFCTYKILFLREAKSLRDHAPYFARNIARRGYAGQISVLASGAPVDEQLRAFA
jgi:hypothetical protein